MTEDSSFAFRIHSELQEEFTTLLTIQETLKATTGTAKFVF